MEGVRTAQSGDVHRGRPPGRQPPGPAPRQRPVRGRPHPKEAQSSPPAHPGVAARPLPRRHHARQPAPVARRHRALVQLQRLHGVGVEHPEHPEHVVGAEDRHPLPQHAHLVRGAPAHMHPGPVVVHARHAGQTPETPEHVRLANRRHLPDLRRRHPYGANRHVAPEDDASQLARPAARAARAHRQRRKPDRRPLETQLRRPAPARRYQKRVHQLVAHPVHHHPERRAGLRDPDRRDPKAVRRPRRARLRQGHHHPGERRSRRRVQDPQSPARRRRVLGRARPRREERKRQRREERGHKRSQVGSSSTTPVPSSHSSVASKASESS